MGIKYIESGGDEGFAQSLEKLNLEYNVNKLIQQIDRTGIVECWYGYLAPVYIFLNQKGFYVRYKFNECIDLMECNYELKKQVNMYNELFLSSSLNDVRDGKQKQKYMPVLKLAELVSKSNGVIKKQYIWYEKKRLKNLTDEVAAIMGVDKEEKTEERVYH